MIAAMNGILTGAELDAVHSASITISRTELNTPHEVQTAVAAFSGSEGWLCLTDEVLVLKQGKPLPSLAGRIILSGELASGLKSLHIRQNGDKWEQYTLERRDGGEQFMLEESFLSIPKGGQCRLKYEIYWQTDATGALAPFAGRFAGFEPGGSI